jgi:hypothetical protein
MAIVPLFTATSANWIINGLMSIFISFISLRLSAGVIFALLTYFCGDYGGPLLLCEYFIYFDLGLPSSLLSELLLLELALSRSSLPLISVTSVTSVAKALAPPKPVGW